METTIGMDISQREGLLEMDRFPTSLREPSLTERFA